MSNSKTEQTRERPETAKPVKIEQPGSAHHVKIEEQETAHPVKIEEPETAQPVPEAEEERDAGEGGAADEKSAEEEKETEVEGEQDDDGEDEDSNTFEKLNQSLLDKLSSHQVSPITAVPRRSYVPDLDQLPASYKDNCPKELKAIAYCKRFVGHYNHLFDRRKPLFLMPKNECGIKKVVSTTINPTQLPYKDLLDWPDIATFVAQYVVYEKLDSPLQLPETLYAPQTVLQRQRGHCFDLSTLLCSMLIGSGYDAYVVSGYASREVCNMDLTYTRCPIIEDDVKVYPRTMERIIRKYTARPRKHYASEYMLRMKIKQDKVFNAAMDDIYREKEEQRRRYEAPPTDELRGWRVHSWVMVLAGNRDIDTTFFIEPTTGFDHPTNWEEYHGIESIWNHLNYYVNVQQDNGHPDTVAKLKYNIGDSRNWEYIFPGQDLHTEVPQSRTRIRSRQHSSRFLLGMYVPPPETHYDLPPSWTLPLKLSRDEYDQRYPMGKASWRFKKAVVDFFSPYLLPTGLVKKLTVFSDLERTKSEYTKEFFAHRHDMLVERFTHHPTGKTIETFDDGREDFLKEHHYFVQTPGPETNRTLLFFNNRRLDHLHRREEGPTFIKDWYDFRTDRKVYKETQFGPTGQIHEEGEGPDARPIEHVIERFCRNKSVPASEDIQEITYSVSSDEIDVVYQVETHRIVQSTRHFTKPDRWWDDTVYLDWKRELHWNFEADVFAKPLSELKLYQMMVELMNKEASTRLRIRKTEKETRKLLETRIKEEQGLKLVKTYCDADRIPDTRVARLKKKARLKEEQLQKKKDIVRDYLEPYLQRLGLTQVSNRRQASRIKDDIMSDLKNRFIYQMDTMRDTYEQIKHEIEVMQEDHARDMVFYPVGQLSDYDYQLTTKMFTAHIMEERMNRLKQYAPIKYRALFDQLKADPRLSSFP